MATVKVWIDDVPDEQTARAAAKRMVAASRDCENNGDIDIDIEEWDYDG
jgi:hypothetical protein